MSAIAVRFDLLFFGRVSFFFLQHNVTVLFFSVAEICLFQKKKIRFQLFLKLWNGFRSKILTNLLTKGTHSNFSSCLGAKKSVKNPTKYHKGKKEKRNMN